jgi:hypothetical protein
LHLPGGGEPLEYRQAVTPEPEVERAQVVEAADQKWEGGKFREWLPVGKGRIEIDGNGNASAENFQDLTSIGGWNGFTALLPIGVKPKDPDPKPKRPQSAEEEDF